MQPQAADKVAELRVRAATASANHSRAEKEATAASNAAILPGPSVSPALQPTRRTMSVQPIMARPAEIPYDGDEALDSDTEDAANTLEEMAFARFNSANLCVAGTLPERVLTSTAAAPARLPTIGLYEVATT